MTIRSAQLGPMQRAAALARLQTEQFDVLVIGGGVTGCGCALDAATRGLSVALVEQRDLASGTSSRSSKLVHGGLRYLEQRNFGLVFEALQERGLLLEHLAPHLVRPVSFLYPLHHRAWERAYVGLGIGLYDVLAHRRGGRALPAHRHLSKRGALALAPGLRPEGLVGAVRYWDAQVDDARHTLTVARTAATYGACIATSTQVVGLLRDGEGVVGVRARCTETGLNFAIRARQVVNATATWTDQIHAMAGQGKLHVRASKGVHLVVPRDRIKVQADRTGLILRTERSVLFVIPWGHSWIVGTTDTDWNLDLAHPAASRADITYLLEELNKVLEVPLVAQDIIGVYAGLRPLLEGERDDPSKLSREHAVSDIAPGLITVAGGKYTTYRVMAADTIDRVARHLGGSIPKSCTSTVPLWGADGWQALWNGRALLARELGLSLDTTEHLLGRYGSGIGELAELISKRPELAAPLAGNDIYLAAEASYAASHEGARHLDDVLTRRTRLSIETEHRGVTSAPAVAALMAEVLGWSNSTIADEVDHYRLRVQAERDSQAEWDDQSADATRLGAPETRHITPVR